MRLIGSFNPPTGLASVTAFRWIFLFPGSFNEAGGGTALDEVQREDFTTDGLDEWSTHDLIDLPVASLDEDLGSDLVNEIFGSVFVKETDEINAGQGREDFRAVVFGLKWTVGTFESFDAGVGINADEECISELSGFLQVSDVADMQKVEAAVGENQTIG